MITLHQGRTYPGVSTRFAFGPLPVGTQVRRVLIYGFSTTANGLEGVAVSLAFSKLSRSAASENEFATFRQLVRAPVTNASPALILRADGHTDDDSASHIAAVPFWFELPLNAQIEDAGAIHVQVALVNGNNGDEVHVSLDAAPPQGLWPLTS